jgi:Raf kinase inhibitor-like YbhB/YbcL family protein
VRPRDLVPLLALLVVACDEGDGRDFSRPPTPDQTASVLTTTIAPETTVTFAPAVGEASTVPTVVGEQELTVRLPWADEGQIDPVYTCEGSDLAPTIEWTGVGPDVAELGLAFIDLDAEGFVHWVVTGISPAVSSIVGGVLPEGASAATNDFGDAAYGGPCPPSGEHQYLLTLYALGTPLELDTEPSANAAINEMEAASIDQVSVAGSYAEGGAAATTTAET